MSAHSVRPRGQPLAMLGLLLACWFSVRALTWEGLPQPPAIVSGDDASLALPDGKVTPATTHKPVTGSAGEGSNIRSNLAGNATSNPVVAHTHNAPLPDIAPPLAPLLAPPVASPQAFSPAIAPETPAGAPDNPARLLSAADSAATRTVRAAPQPAMAPRSAVGHTLMLAAAVTEFSVPPELLAYFLPGSLMRNPEERGQANAALRAGDFAVFPGLPSGGPVLPARVTQARWSADGWVFWRRNTTDATTNGLAGYGRSQAGAVVRWRPFPGSAWQPALFLRGSVALDSAVEPSRGGMREREVALGVSVRPHRAVPVVLAAEARVFDGAGGTYLRPAAYAVTTLPPARFPMGLRGEAYVAGGYVGGRQATPFVDGQASVDARAVRMTDNAELRLGAGAWGGAQDGAARLDAGPSARIEFAIGPVRGRASADYRFRVAGDAEPASGPAVTLSVGF